MKKEERGSVESLLDGALKEEILGDIDWVRKEIPLTSYTDFAVGYTIGVLKTLATMHGSMPSLVRTKRFSWLRSQKDRAIDEILKRRLPEILGKIQTELNR